MEYTSKRAMGVASFFGSVVLYDAILRIFTHYPLVVVVTSNTLCFNATPLPPSFPTRRM